MMHNYLRTYSCISVERICTASACIMCRNLEISFATHQLLWTFVYESEATRLAESAAALLPVMRDGLQHALQQENHRTTKFSTNCAAANYLQLVGQMCVSHEMYVEKSLRAGILPLAAIALTIDINRFYWEVRRASEYVLCVLQASSGKHVRDVRKEIGIKEGLQKMLSGMLLL